MEMDHYKRCMDQIHAPEAAYTEVWNMISKQKRSGGRHIGRRVLLSAAAATMLLALGLTAYAVGPTVFGWGGNFELQPFENGETAALLHTDSLTDPVVIADGRMLFIVNSESVDITDEISESKAFLYDYTDEEMIIHYWIIGKNGVESDNYGYAEFLRSSEGDWLGGYSARTNLDDQGKGPLWLEEGKRELNIPW